MEVQPPLLLHEVDVLPQRFSKLSSFVMQSLPYCRCDLEFALFFILLGKLALFKRDLVKFHQKTPPKSIGQDASILEPDRLAVAGCQLHPDGVFLQAVVYETSVEPLEKRLVVGGKDKAKCGLQV